MNSNLPDVLAFTIKHPVRVNVLKSKVGVSATLKLFPEAKLQEYTAIWDTGATNTTITPKVVRELGLIPTGYAEVNTAGGKITVNTYIVDIVLPNSVRINSVRISEVPEIANADMLIGMDIMGLGDMAISNFSGGTTFSFRIPPQESIDFVELWRKSRTVINDTPTIGRNSKCPCGSGKKYKQCCGKK